MTKNKVLIIGSEGFFGKSYVNYYSNKTNIDKELYTVDIHEIAKQNYFNCDATNFNQIDKIIKTVSPNEIYNFSGSFSNDFEIDFLNNVVITKNIFDSIKKSELDCRILINGSAAEYGLIKSEKVLVNEDYPLNPVSFYGLTKAYQTFLAKTYHNKYNIKVYIARPFNPIGYGISEHLFIGRLISQIKDCLKMQSSIILGDLYNERDYIDIEDIIRSYEVIMTKGQAGEVYNIGSGKSIKIRDLLLRFLVIFGIEDTKIEKSNNFVKKFDIPKIVADITKVKALDWEPTIPLEESIKRIKKCVLSE